MIKKEKMIDFRPTIGKIDCQHHLTKFVLLPPLETRKADDER